jgi:tetratricopeptide (TPR) repeat protein
MGAVWKRCLATLILGIGLSAHTAMQAAAGACGIEREVGVGALDEWTWRQLNAIYEEVGDDRYDEAFDDLTRLLERSGRDRYLQAILNQALAQVEWARGRYEASLRYFERAVELDTLPDETHFALQYQIAQLYYAAERFEEAHARLELWFCSVPPEKVTSSAFVLAAGIHARREDHAAALEAIGKAIDMDPSPKEEWYLLKLAAHFEMEQLAEAAGTLEILVENWPGDRRYWLQLAQVSERLGQSSRALAVLALANRRELLDREGDITFLSGLYSRAELPYKAAEVLENGIRTGVVTGNGTNWSRVADAWYAAAELERALAAYREAGRASGDGDSDLRRAHILIDLERWPAAVEALDLALSKGGLDDRRTGEALLLRGMARYSLENYDDATADWERAGRYETARDAAAQWLNHLREERRRQAS